VHQEQTTPESIQEEKRLPPYWQLLQNLT
jgi:hypothetical protein